MEELEPIIAPGTTWNHNEVLPPVEDVDMEIEELEEIIAPGHTLNHNEACDSE